MLDRFFGFGQSLIVKTKLIPFSAEMTPLLEVLNEFRMTYYKYEL